MRTFFRAPAIRQFRTARCQPLPSRAFSVAQPLRLKEDKAQDPQEIENAKNEQMKPGKGQGKERSELSSSSESHIAADKQEVDDHGEHMEDLQKETAGQHEKSHPEGKAEH